MVDIGEVQILWKILDQLDTAARDEKFSGLREYVLRKCEEARREVSYPGEPRTIDDVDDDESDDVTLLTDEQLKAQLDKSMEQLGDYYSLPDDIRNSAEYRALQNDANVLAAEHGRRNPLKCPHCGSTNWRCYDESNVDCYSEKDDIVYAVPLGSFVCNACGGGFQDGGCEAPDKEFDDE